MRFDNRRRLVTLDEDIIRIWRLHGWKVLEEKVSGRKWTITAELIKGGRR